MTACGPLNRRMCVFVNYKVLRKCNGDHYSFKLPAGNKREKSACKVSGQILLSVKIKVDYTRGWQTFSTKGQIINMSIFEAHKPLLQHPSPDRVS